jgi:hypothetical protein
MKRLALIILLCGCAVAKGMADDTTRRALRSELLSNTGAVNMSGLPRLSFELGGGSELSAMGFFFRLTHAVRISSNQRARSEWTVGGLRTCVYVDGQGDLIWIKPSGQKTRFPRQGMEFGGGDDGSAADVSKAGVVEIKSRQGALWRYKGGFLEMISDARSGNFSVITNRESILAISKPAVGTSTAAAVLRVEYSETGMPRRIVFSNGRACGFEWSRDYRLLRMENASGVRTLFEYDGALLTRWGGSSVVSGTYKWATRADAKRGIALGIAPVVLGEDGVFCYEYIRKGSVNSVRIHTTDGSFVSETSIGPGGISQRTPSGVRSISNREKTQ